MCRGHKPKAVSMNRKPRRFFKYVSIANDIKKFRAQEIFTQSKIYFTSPSKFNDPFDCKLNMLPDGSPEQYKEVALKLLNEREAGNSLVEQQKKAKFIDDPENRSSMVKTVCTILQEKIDHLGVYCLSTDPKNILMWSHYGDAHKGICLEFDSTQAFFSEALQVNYSSNYPENRFVAPKFEGLTERVVLTKAKYWNYEKEWRILQPSQGYFCFNPNAITGLILGARITDDNIRSIQGWIRNRGPGFMVRKAELHEREYAITFPRK